MSKPQTYPLDSVRTDGWFERIGQGIGSFRTLCEIVGDRFFAFSMITGARITALTVDRRNPDETLVDFVVGADGEEDVGDVQRLALPDFRKRLVAALLADSTPAPPPQRDTDVEALQQHIGVRYLLLAPLYGYSLRTLEVDPSTNRSVLQVLLDGRETALELGAFQQRIRAHVRDELQRASGPQRSTIDLGLVAEAEVAARQQDWRKVIQLLGSWPAPLAILLRTPEGQALSPDTSLLIAKALATLGSACVQLKEVDRAEEIFRLGVQYAQGNAAAPDIFTRFGEAVLGDGRPGEAIGLLRRALALGAPAARVQPLLARALVKRKRFVAAASCVHEALRAGVPADQLSVEMQAIAEAFESLMPQWREVFEWSAGPASQQN